LQDVQDTIENLYTVFAAKKPPQGIDACYCCLSEEEIKMLLAKPLRNLNAEVLSSYTMSVFLTVGSEEDYRYFLPRILEIVFQKVDWWPSKEVVFERLGRANWLSWSAIEKKALCEYFDAFFEYTIGLEKNAARHLDDLLCGLGLAGVNLQAYLTRLEHPDLHSLLLGYFEENASSLEKGTLSNSFWSNNRDKATTIIEWFQSDKIQALIWSHYNH